MNSLFNSVNPLLENLPRAGVWLRAVNLICLVGAVISIVAILVHWNQHRAARDGREPGRNVMARVAFVTLLAAAAVGFVQVWFRYIEVNHFPSQTMSEVLVMFSLALLVSMIILHLAVNLERIGFGWAIVSDSLLLLVFSSVLLVNHYSSTLSSAQKDLPPALQSYWFPPHLSALMISYATLGIAGLACLIYFAVRFWDGVHHGNKTRVSQVLILLGLLLVPFGHLVTIPILLLVGLVFLVLRVTGKLPQPEAMVQLEKTMDQVSYRYFSVGIPFLTAGLFMGAFWAQEAWANYWGWDSKENSALITWLVYVIYIHLRMLGGYRGEKAMAVLAGGALSVFLTFQVFGYLPDSQKSLHRYTDDNVVPREGMQGAASTDDRAARLDDTK